MRKDPFNKTAAFLQKAQQQNKLDNIISKVDNYILDSILSGDDEIEIAQNLQAQYGLDFYELLDRVQEMKSIYETDTAKLDKPIELVPDAEDYFQEEVQENPGYQYTPDETEPIALADDWAWDDEETLSPGMLEEKKKGGKISKSKFAKKVVKNLKKAAEGMQQESNQASINDIPVNGRNQFVSNFRRGIKDLGNEYYAKQMYDGMKAEQGQQVDTENPMHHLKAYSDSVANVFQTPMNQINTVGSDEIPEAKYGRRMARQAARQWDKTFGKIPVGMFGPGTANYLSAIIPGQMPMVNPANFIPSGVDVVYSRKGPFRKSMEIRNIPFYIPQGMQTGYTSTYDYPGEIITREKTTTEKAFGGPVSNPQMDQYGQLQKFIGGGDDMPMSAYSAYSENDIDTKDVTDPYYRNGGLYKFDGEEDSQVTAQNTPYKSYASQEDYDADINAQKQQWELDFYRNMYGKNTNQNSNQQGNQSQYSYRPISSNPWENIADAFRIKKQNPTYTFYQTGPMTSNGQPYTSTDGKAPFTMQTDPTKAGYRPSVTYDQSGLFGRKKTAHVDWNWYDPANQNTNMNPSTPPAVDTNPYADLSGRAQRQIRRGERRMGNVNENPNIDYRNYGIVGKKEEKRYGGMPRFQGLDDSEVSFDANDNNQSRRPTVDAMPMRPYTPMGYSSADEYLNRPQAKKPSFGVDYRIKEDKYNEAALNNWKNLIGFGAKGVADNLEGLYQDQYLNDRTTSDNMVTPTEPAFSGTYSGLNQRRIADTDTNPYFTGVVKKGGAIKYKQGGVYDLSEEEIGAILAAGGQIEFI